MCRYVLYTSEHGDIVQIIPCCIYYYIALETFIYIYSLYHYPCAPLATTVTSRHFMFTLSPVPSSRADDLRTPLPSIHLI